MSSKTTTIELVQWHCTVPTCGQFGGGLSIEPGQAHADANGHRVDAEVTTTVRETIILRPRA